MAFLSGERTNNRCILEAYDMEVVHEDFKPHITLAYVKPEFLLPANVQLEMSVLQVGGTRLST